MFKSLLNTLIKKTAKKTKGEKVTFVISGMHCSSCSLNIDMALEELPGVSESSTHFAKGKTTVTYDPNKVSPQKIEAKIKETGYTAILV